MYEYDIPNYITNNFCGEKSKNVSGYDNEISETENIVLYKASEKASGESRGLT